MNKKNIFKSDYAYSLLAKVLHIILGIFITVFINRALGAELKGNYAYIHNIATIVVIIGGLGIYQQYPFYRRKNPEIINKFIAIIFIIVIIYTALLVISSPFILLSSMTQTTKIIYFLVCADIITQILSTALNMLASVEDFKKCKKRDIVLNIIRFFLFLTMYIAFKKNLIAIFIFDFVYYFILSISMLYILSIKRINLKVDKIFVKEILKMGFFPMMFTLLLSFNYNLDIIYMKNFTAVTFTNIGLYSVGVQFIGYLWTIPDIFKEVLYSKTAKEDSIKDILYCIKISLFLEIVIWLIFLIIGKQFIILLYGTEYEGATIIVWIMIFGILSMSLFKILTPLYNAKGNFKVNLLILLTSVIINIILNIVLVPKYDIIGAAIASVIGYSICGLWYLIRFTVEYKIPLKNMIFITKNDISYIHKKIKSILKTKSTIIKTKEI